MTMGTQLGYDPGNFYVWRASDGFAIHLSLNVVTRLAAQIAREGNESQPGGMRGILLGRITDTPFRTTVIEDFKLFPPSKDGEQTPEFEDALIQSARRMAEAGSQQRPLGFFRARREGTLNMGQRDMQTFGRQFCEPGNVALLIQTSRRGKDSDAALFYWQDGRPQPHDFGFGFPLDAGQLASGHPGWRYPDPLDHAPAPVTLAAPVAPPPSKPPAPEWTPPPPPSSARNEIRWSRLLPTAALVAICVGALQMETNSSRAVAAAPSATESAASETSTSAALPMAMGAETENGLALSVTSRQHQLEIRWNRESAAIAASDQGVMKITDDGITEAVPLDPSQLRDGYVSYTPKTTDVNIRLEVTGRDGGTTSESVRAVAIP